MRYLVQRTRFRRDYKLQKLRGKKLEKLDKIIRTLLKNGAIDVAYYPHKLSREWDNVWECHIEPDWLLIYKITDSEVLLIRTGTHADLFK